MEPIIPFRHPKFIDIQQHQQRTQLISLAEDTRWISLLSTRMTNGDRWVNFNKEDSNTVQSHLKAKQWLLAEVLQIISKYNSHLPVQLLILFSEMQRLKSGIWKSEYIS